MYTKQLDNGITNNYAVEPQLTYQEYPTFYEQRRYLAQGGIAILLVTIALFISIAVS